MELTAYTKKIESETWNRRNVNKQILYSLRQDKRVLDKAILGEYATLDSRVALDDFPLEDLMAGTGEAWTRLDVVLQDASNTHNEWHDALQQADDRHYKGTHRLWRMEDHTMTDFLEKPDDKTMRRVWERYIRNEGNQHSDYLLDDYRLTRAGTAEADLQILRSLAISMTEMTEGRCMEQMRAYCRVMQQDYEQTTLFRLFRRTIDLRSAEWDATPLEYVRFYLERRTRENIPAFIKFLRYYRNRYWLWRFMVGDEQQEMAGVLDDTFPHVGGCEVMPAPIDSALPLSANREVSNLQEQNEMLRNQVKGLKAELAMSISMRELADYAINKADEALARTLKLAVLEMKKDLTIAAREELERIDEAFRTEKKRLMEEAARHGLTVETAASDVLPRDEKGTRLSKCHPLCVAVNSHQRLLLDKAEEAGIIVYNSDNKGYDVGEGNSQALVAYLCGRVFCQDSTAKDGTWEAGTRMDAAEQLMQLFGFDVSKTRRSTRQGGNGFSPVGHERVDLIFTKE